MIQITWTEQALSDIEEIRGFIARDAPTFAELFVDRIIAAVEQLILFPEAGRVVPEFSRSDLRELIRGSYRVVYQVDGEHVFIVTVFHTARLLGPEHIAGL